MQRGTSNGRRTMGMMQRLADVNDGDSLSNRLRNRRFRRFEALSEGLPRPIRILDFGGTAEFWRQRGWDRRADIEITTVNLGPDPSPAPNIAHVAGDVADLSIFDDGSFDVAFSNSVIEHLETLERQARMAAEMQRIGRALWCQTPSFWFPIEPHFHVPGWQWLPQGARISLLRRFRCGQRGPCPDAQAAAALVREVRLMRRGELRRLFPNATIEPERFCGAVKSWIVQQGFAGREERATAPADRSADRPRRRAA
jgi:hypothetical protein